MKAGAAVKLPHSHFMLCFVARSRIGGNRRACKSPTKTGGSEFTWAFGIADKRAALSWIAETVRFELLAEEALGVGSIDARARKSGSEH
jgi:hypothetical protein